MPAKKSRRIPRGIVVWEGPSQLTGEPTVMIITFISANRATGPECQSWIIRSDMDPTKAVQTGADVAICGDCPMRGLAKGDRTEGRGCMVVPFNGGPGIVYKQYVAGAYPKATDTLMRRHLAHQMLRVGSYGDPVAVPLPQWEWALGYTRGHTGYTHQWKNAIAQPYRFICMASVDCEADTKLAVDTGWRYFRNRREGDPVLPGEIVCPKSPEGGERELCFTCGACNGWKRKGQKNVVIIAHGSAATKSNAVRVLDRLAILNPSAN